MTSGGMGRAPCEWRDGSLDGRDEGRNGSGGWSHTTVLGHTGPPCGLFLYQELRSVPQVVVLPCFQLRRASRPTNFISACSLAGSLTRAERGAHAEAHPQCSHAGGGAVPRLEEGRTIRRRRRALPARDRARPGWSLRYMLHRTAREMGLRAAYRPGAEGKPPIAIVSLADARLAAKAARVKIKAGVDPLAEHAAEEHASRVADEAMKAAALAASPARTFKSAFDEWLAAHGPAMRTERQRVQAQQLVARHVFPTIGSKPLKGARDALDDCHRRTNDRDDRRHLG
jgi:hypothetical protein